MLQRKTSLLFFAAVSLAIGLHPPVLSGQVPAQPADSPELSRQVTELKALVEKLQARVADLENRVGPAPPVNAAAARPAEAIPAVTAPAPPTPEPHSGSDLLHGATFNLLLDGYYGYNFNAPIGRANLLRAYDVTSNGFSLNQAAVVTESAPDTGNGKRWGVRLDLQFGQATETLQGNPANEPRPDIYRNIFQAYGTYVVPVGNGITVDFGKWASSIGLEGNYTKDQINYSRSFWFTFLPFYHMGVRANAKVNDWLSVNYWVTNGTNQTEPFNGFKDELWGVVLQPRKTIDWTINYYMGQEHPDSMYYPNGAPAGLGNLPAQQGVPFAPIPNPPTGHLNIIDTYLTWQVSPSFQMAFEGDDEIERLYRTSPPSHTIGGAVYARYQVAPKLAFGVRSEYLSDRGGLFSGVTQALKENTVTLEYKLVDNFVARLEWRRDASNQPYFLTTTLGILKKEQNTATVGLVWWFGSKQGIW